MSTKQGGEQDWILAHGIAWNVNEEILVERELRGTDQKTRRTRDIAQENGLYILSARGTPMHIGDTGTQGFLQSLKDQWEQNAASGWDEFTWFMINRRAKPREPEVVLKEVLIAALEPAGNHEGTRQLGTRYHQTYRPGERKLRKEIGLAKFLRLVRRVFAEIEL